MTKQIVYVDMDGVLVDLGSAIDELDPQVRAAYGDNVDEVPHLFSDPKPIEGAIEAFKKLSKVYDVYILSTAPWGNTSAWGDKKNWVEKHIGKAAHKRLILSHNKHLCAGDYLIEDRRANGASKFNGELIQFGTKKFENWDKVLEYLNVDFLLNQS
jgi:5'-nucleotidase